MRSQVAHVGEETARAEGGMAVAGVDGGDENGGFNIHCSNGFDDWPIGGEGAGKIEGDAGGWVAADDAGGVEPVAGMGW